MEAMRFWLMAAAASGFLAVALGAFAAHGLQGRMSAEQAGWFATGLRYHMFHVAGLLAVALLFRSAVGSSLALTVAGWGFLLGSAVFCGLLYVMALGGARWLGAVVPLGGLAFLAGWASLFFYALRRIGTG
jgi:uncharacterized membrane protein YgdD (TMEM256/DUF423 family)